MPSGPFVVGSGSAPVSITIENAIASCAPFGQNVPCAAVFSVRAAAGADDCVSVIAPIATVVPAVTKFLRFSLCAVTPCWVTELFLSVVILSSWQQ